MRAIVKPWDFIIEVEKICHGSVISKSGHYYIEHFCEIINEDEWDAEIYALLLIESGVIYE